MEQAKADVIVFKLPHLLFLSPCSNPIYDCLVLSTTVNSIKCIFLKLSPNFRIFYYPKFCFPFNCFSNCSIIIILQFMRCKLAASFFLMTHENDGCRLTLTLGRRTLSLHSVIMTSYSTNIIYALLI